MIKKHKFLRLLWRFLAYARFIIVLGAIAAQLTLFLLFILRWSEQQEIYWGMNFALSLFFVIYLLGTHSKNEFKIAWMIPVLAVPIIGITIYLVYVINLGRITTKRQLKSIKGTVIPYLQQARDILQPQPDPALSGIDTYLYHSEGWLSYTPGDCTYFPCGEAMLEQYLADLRSAEKTIFFEYFIVSPGVFWDRVLAVLKERASKGVEIRMLYDGWGSIAYAGRSYERWLAASGIRAKTFQSIIPFFDVSLNNRDHRKITVIDNRICYTGGLNIADEYVNIGRNKFPYWKDAAIRLTGPAAISFSAMFLELWHLSHKTDPSEDCRKFITGAAGYWKEHRNTGTLIPYGDDAFNTDDLAEDVYIHLISQAQKQVCFMSPYAVFDNHLLNTLIMAARRGVQVQIIVPQVYDHYVTWCMGRVILRKLIQNGVQVFCYQKGFIHSKVCISDSQLATVGTINLDYRSFSTNFECGVLLHAVPEIAAMEQDYAATLAECTELTIENYRKIPLVRRFIGHLLLPLAPIF
ncbi:MAG: phospholipase D-like domain-containing protein [Treponemataceae bacterium]|nr:phospholipase D-like domain-containing protein [Treponemataceae bacterium]